MTRPMAWFTALDACCRYQSCPERNCGNGGSVMGTPSPCCQPPSPAGPHLGPSPTPALHLVQELHLQDDPWVLARWVWQPRDDHPAAIQVCEVQPLTGLGTAPSPHLAVPQEPVDLPRARPPPHVLRDGSGGRDLQPWARPWLRATLAEPRNFHAGNPLNQCPPGLAPDRVRRAGHGVRYRMGHPAHSAAPAPSHELAWQGAQQASKRGAQTPGASPFHGTQPGRQPRGTQEQQRSRSKHPSPAGRGASPSPEPRPQTEVEGVPPSTCTGSRGSAPSACSTSPRNMAPGPAALVSKQGGGHTQPAAGQSAGQGQASLRWLWGQGAGTCGPLRSQPCSGAPQTEASGPPASWQSHGPRGEAEGYRSHCLSEA